MKQAVLSILCIFFFLGIGAQNAVPAQEKKSDYTRSASDGVLISSESRWYFEEFDSLERPVSGTLWEKGEIIERRSWLYADERQAPEKKIVTGLDWSTETTYDASGNELVVTKTDGKGEVISILSNTYNKANRLSESLLTAGEKKTKTVFEYTDTEILREKQIYINDEITIGYIYESEDNWRETIYSKGKSVLVVTYKNGARIKGSDAKN